jgi:cytochrome c oxidase subunit 2
MNHERRSLLVKSLAGAGALLCEALLSRKAAATEQVITIQAKKFSFTPNDIVVKKDVPLVLEITSVDIAHGFYIPQMDVQADLLPDRTAYIRLLPKTAGVFTFVCDSYCGPGHDAMIGKLTVKD